jgi:hypothetical protein
MLATCPYQARRDKNQELALGLTTQAAKLAPENLQFAATRALAQIPVEPKSAITTIDGVRQSRGVLIGREHLILSIAHSALNNKEAAKLEYEQGVRWANESKVPHREDLAILRMLAEQQTENDDAVRNKD